jgi:NitT/TauT family transport system substrate-binding protein
VLSLKHVSTGELFPSLEPQDAMQNYLSKVISPPAMTSKIDLEKFVDTRFAKEAGAK